MEIEENLNPKPNSYGTSKSWSELPQDLLCSVFNRLGFAAFQRAKYVCSSWHYASKNSLPKNHNHWLILFPDDTHPCCTLFNPQEKDKLYRMKDLGVEVFAGSACIASYESWLLMKYHGYNNLYVVNLFTKENINLPPLERGSVICHVFWIDEKTKDYVVLYGRSHRFEKSDVVYCYKKGDDNVNLSCKKIPETSNCLNLVYKDHKLYFLSSLGIFKIFDFREDILKETFQCGVEIGQQVCHQLSLVAKKLVVNVTGEVVFKVEKLYRPMFGTWSTWVFKIYSSGFLKKHEVVDSLGDEAILFDQGITVLATTANEGFIRNSIYFSNWEYNRDHDMFRFNLETKKAEPLHKFYFSVLQFSEWFLPSFTHT